MRLKYAAVLLFAASVPCLADVTFNGNFQALGLDPQFDAYLGTFVLPAPTDVSIRSYGYSMGGFDPIVSLFQGSGPSAVFLDLNDDEVFGVVMDSFLSFTGLPADTYTLAITYTSNAPNAYYFGGGTLGDGFIGLGWQDLSHSDYFQVTVSGAEVPEPSAILLLSTCAALLAYCGLRRARRRSVG
jgi:hypothetical protein